MPTLVDQETEQLVDMAHRDLCEYALNTNVSVTTQEVRDFLARNEGDLHQLLEGCSEDQLAAMMRKLIMQLPANVMGVKDDVPPANVQEQQQDSLQNLMDLEVMVSASLKSSGVLSWSILADLLTQNFRVYTDPVVLDILQSLGFNHETQKFPKKGKTVRAVLLRNLLDTNRDSLLANSDSQLKSSD